MAFQAAHPLGEFAAQMRSAHGPFVLPEMSYFSDGSNSSVSSEHHLPSPRTWLASRTSSPPDFSPCPSETLSEGETDGSSDACAEIAEWMAYSCIGDEVSATQAIHQEYAQFPKPYVPAPPPRPIQKPHFIHDLHTGSRRTGLRNLPASVPGSVAWSAACSSESSQTGSPTSVLGEAGSAAWDLLFAAASEVQKLAREQDALIGHRYNNSPRSVQQLLLNRGHMHSPTPSKLSKSPLAPTVYSQSPVAEYADHNSSAGSSPPLSRSDSPEHRNRRKSGGAGVRSPACPARSNGMMSPQRTKLSRPGVAAPLDDISGSRKSLYSDFTAAGSPVNCSPIHSQTASNTTAKDAKVGTGVFLPRSAVPLPTETRAPVKKVNKPATVILPARLVHALGLNVDPESNVVIGKPLQPSRRTSSNKSQQVHLPPVMRMAADEDVATMTKSARHANCRQPYSSKARSHS